MVIISVSKDFEPILDEFICHNPDIELKKLKSKNFSGSTEMITLVTIITPIIIPEITKLVGTLLELYKEKNRHEEESIKEKNRHEEELLEANMAQINIMQKNDDFDSEVIIHLKAGEQDSNIQELLDRFTKSIKSDEK